MGGYLEVIYTPLEFGANLTPKADTFNDSEASPLLLAYLSNNPELVSLFLDRGAEISIKMKNGKGPLHFAIYYGHIETS